MHKITRARIKLIRGLQSAEESTLFTPTASQIITAIVQMIREDQRGFYVALSNSDSRMVSYSSKPEFRLDIRHRTKTTLGRFLRKRLKISNKHVSDKELEYLAGIAFSAKVGQKSLFEKLKGHDIRTAYRREVGVHTCMTDCNSNLVELYCQNPERVELLVYGQSQGRALFWKTDDGKQVMDRVYSSDQGVITTFYEWARRRGHIYRQHNSWPDGDIPMSDGAKHFVTLDSGGLSSFPYMDTFTYGKFMDDRGRLVLSNQMRFGNIGMLSPSGRWHTKCELCNKDWVKHHVQEGQICNPCFNKLYYRCGACGNTEKKGGELVYRDSIYCPKCQKRNFRTCDACAKTHLRGDGITFKDTGESLCFSCIGNIEVHQCRSCHDHFRDKSLTYQLSVKTNQQVRCGNCLPTCHICRHKYLVHHSQSLCPVCEIARTRSGDYNPNQFAHRRRGTREQKDREFAREINSGGVNWVTFSTNSYETDEG